MKGIPFLKVGWFPWKLTFYYWKSSEQDFPKFMKISDQDNLPKKNPTFYSRKDSLMHIFTCQSQQNGIVNGKINDIRFSYNKFTKKQLWNRVMNIVLVFTKRSNNNIFLQTLDRKGMILLLLFEDQYPSESISYQFKFTFPCLQCLGLDLSVSQGNWLLLSWNFSFQE